MTKWECRWPPRAAARISQPGKGKRRSKARISRLSLPGWRFSRICNTSCTPIQTAPGRMRSWRYSALSSRSRDEPCDRERRRGGEAARDRRLRRALERAGAGVVALYEAEDGEGGEGEDDRDDQRRARRAEDHVRHERYQSADDVGDSDDGGARAGARGIGFLQPQLEAHHEVDPLLRPFRHRVDDGAHLIVGHTVF